MLRVEWADQTLFEPVWHGRATTPGAALRSVDILRDPAGLRDAVGGADAVLLLAGIVPGRGDLADNARLAAAVLAALDTVGSQAPVLLCSSGAVYGRAAGPWRETDSPRPETAYGRAKLEMENLARNSRRNVTCLRIGNVAGADALLPRLNEPGPVALDRFADGQGPRRSYIGPRTLARVLAELIGRSATGPLPPVLNVAAPGTVAMADLLDAAGAEWHWQPAPPSALPDLTLDVSCLAGLVALDAAEGTPRELVAQWRSFLEGRDGAR